MRFYRVNLLINSAGEVSQSVTHFCIIENACETGVNLPFQNQVITATKVTFRTQELLLVERMLDTVIERM